MAHAVEVTQVGVDIGRRHFARVVEALGAGDAGEDDALDGGLVASADAVAHQFGVLAGAVRGPVGDGIALAAHEDDAVAGFLVGSFVVVAADDGSAVAAAALVAVPEDFHQVTRDSPIPHVEGAPLVIGHIALVGLLAVALALGATVGGEAITGAQLPHQHAQAGTVGVGTSPESHAVVLPHSIGVELVGTAHAGLHVNPGLTFDFVTGVPDEQGLDEHAIGRARAERRLRQHRVKVRALVGGRHLVGIVQASPGGLGEELIGATARVVTAVLGERVNGSKHRPLPVLVDSSERRGWNP